MENEIAAKFPPNCSVKSTEQKSEGGLTRVAPLEVEAAFSSERSVCGAFARLFNKQDCRQSYYRE